MSGRGRLKIGGRLSIGILLLNALAASPAFAQEQLALGRLFYSAQERLALDARASGQMPDTGGGPVELAPAELRFNGFVHRSLGASTAWVDGAPLATTPTDPVHARARVVELRGETLRVERAGGPFELRAGERLTVDGTRVDGEGRVVNGDDQAAPLAGTEARR